VCNQQFYGEQAPDVPTPWLDVVDTVGIVVGLRRVVVAMMRHSDLRILLTNGISRDERRYNT